MPELPDIVLYLEHLTGRLHGQTLEKVMVRSPNLLRTARPPLSDLVGKRVVGLERLGKRIVIEFEGSLFLVFHLMIAGRFHWRTGEAKLPGKVGMAIFRFSSGSLVLTEASPKKRASLHLLVDRDALQKLDPGGMDVLDGTLEEFVTCLRAENHTVKRSLTDPHLFSGIGNAYSDEILHAARISPLRLSQKMTREESERLFVATQTTLRIWIKRLREENGEKFPEKVTAFRKGMAVHGKYRSPCPVCGSPIQRIVHASNEMNYCATCQTGGKLLADRALSRLLKKDWPKTIEEWEEGRPGTG